jgi:hypothetical protein
MADNLLLDRLRTAHRELQDAMEMLINNKDYAEPNDCCATLMPAC